MPLKKLKTSALKKTRHQCDPDHLHVAAYDLDALVAVAFALGGFFKGGRGLFGGLLAGLALGSHLVDQEAAQHQHDDAEVAQVGFQRNGARGELGDHPGAADAADRQGRAQRSHQTAHLVVVEAGDQAGKTHQPLVGYADGVCEKLVDRVAFAKGLGIVGQAEHGDVAHTGHDTAEGTHGGEHPSDPDRPQQAHPPGGGRGAQKAHIAGIFAALLDAVGKAFLVASPILGSSRLLAMAAFIFAGALSAAILASCAMAVPLAVKLAPITIRAATSSHPITLKCLANLTLSSS
jgi:hypothetical protein